MKNKRFSFTNVNIVHLLRRHVEGLGPHVDLLEHVDAGEDEEDAGAARAAGQQQPQPEDDCSLVLLTRHVDTNVDIRIRGEVL